ncbi:response regulator [bacterium]|nr:MAG: response regulator [bacterium]
MRVLLADDSSIVRGRMASLLTDLKEVEIIGEAQDVPEAVESVTRLKPDLVILDIQMPGGTGIDALEKIKRDKPAPIVMMFSNDSYSQYRQRCMELGADYFFDKSTEVDKLLTALEQRVADPI